MMLTTMLKYSITTIMTVKLRYPKE